MADKLPLVVGHKDKSGMDLIHAPTSKIEMVNRMMVHYISIHSKYVFAVTRSFQAKFQQCIFAEMQLNHE